MDCWYFGECYFLHMPPWPIFNNVYYLYTPPLTHTPPDNTAGKQLAPANILRDRHEAAAQAGNTAAVPVDTSAYPDILLPPSHSRQCRRKEEHIGLGGCGTKAR